MLMAATSPTSEDTLAVISGDVLKSCFTSALVCRGNSCSAGSSLSQGRNEPSGLVCSETFILHQKIYLKCKTTE